jgi:hypothetical protein
MDVPPMVSSKRFRELGRHENAETVPDTFSMAVCRCKVGIEHTFSRKLPHALPGLADFDDSMDATRPGTA